MKRSKRYVAVFCDNCGSEIEEGVRGHYCLACSLWVRKGKRSVHRRKNMIRPEVDLELQAEQEPEESFSL